MASPPQIEDKYTDEEGWTYCNGLLHSFDDQPAVIQTWGVSRGIGWPVFNRTRHQEDPATLFTSLRWYKNGKLQRYGDLPAMVDSIGNQSWHSNNELHRDGDQPAKIHANGTKE